MEYKIITGSAPDCQKKLNQWKHEYNLTILAMTSHKIAQDSQLWTVILLTRERKGDT